MSMYFNKWLLTEIQIGIFQVLEDNYTSNQLLYSFLYDVENYSCYS